MRLIAAAAGLAIIGLSSSIAVGPKPLLIWNASASAPVGLYRIERGRRLAPGDTVAARLTGAAGSLADRRKYLPHGIPAIKRVAAVGGQLVCASGATLSIDGRIVARRLRRDRQGRNMPWWNGCARLGRGELLLLNEPWSSFDGRYFGPTSQTEVIGKAVLLWAA